MLVSAVFPLKLLIFLTFLMPYLSSQPFCSAVKASWTSITASMISAAKYLHTGLSRLAATQPSAAPETTLSVG